MRASLLIGLFVSFCALALTSVRAGEPWLGDASSSKATEADAIERIPFARLTAEAQENIRNVVERPSFFRRLPTQSIDCDPELFTFLVRYPEVIVNIWDLMEITKVEIKRIAPYVFTGHDGAGTTSRCELLYGTSDTHVYYGTGKYAGNMAPREVNGRCVSILHSSVSSSSNGRPLITVSMDIFMKLDNLGADLLTRTLGPLVGKTADYNFVESAKFVSQVSHVCENNPMAAQQLAQKLTKCDTSVRTRFAQIAARIAANHSHAVELNEFAQEGELAAELLKNRPTVPAPEKLSEIVTDKQGDKSVERKISDRTAQSDLKIKPAALDSQGSGSVIKPAKPPTTLRR